MEVTLAGYKPTMSESEIKAIVSKAYRPVAKNLARFTVTRNDRVADQVYRHLRQAILADRIAPDTRLRETEIAAALKVSRTPVREAISRLIGDRTAVINQLRGFLLEHGIVVRQGHRFLRHQLPQILATRTDVLSPLMVRIIWRPHRRLGMSR